MMMMETLREAENWNRPGESNLWFKWKYQDLHLSCDFDDDDDDDDDDDN
jgi:hypothetical protein